MQHLRYPGLPPENVEYEPYILIQNMQKLEKEDPVDRVHFIFGFGFLNSLKALYEENGQKIFWNNPQWFLRNVDGIAVKK